MKYNVVDGVVVEYDPSGKVTGGVKFDGGKAPVMQGAIEYFGKALKAVAFVSLFGYEKYGEWQGWRKVPDAFNRYSNALGRHVVSQNDPNVYDGSRLIELLKGLVPDPSVKLMHLSQAAWNALAALELQIEAESKTGTP